MRPPLTAHLTLPVVKGIPLRCEAIDYVKPVIAARLTSTWNWING